MKTNTTENIFTKFDAPLLLKAVIEGIAGKHVECRYEETAVPTGLKSAETSTVESYVSGGMIVSSNDVSFRDYFLTRFIFTCTRFANTEFEMTWASSLS